MAVLAKNLFMYVLRDVLDCPKVFNDKHDAGWTGNWFGQRCVMIMGPLTGAWKLHTHKWKNMQPTYRMCFLFFKVWIHNLIHGWNPTKQSQMRPSPKLWLKMFTKHTLTGDRSAGNFIWAFLQLILGSHFFGTFNIYVLFSSTELAQLQNMVQERCRFAQLFSTYLTVGSNLRPVVQIWGLAIH